MRNIFARHGSEHRRIFRCAAFFCAAAALLMSGCPYQQSEEPSSAFPGSEWDTALPEEVGMSSEGLQHLQDYLGRYKSLSLLVVRRGKIVWEHYWRDSDQDAKSDWYSVCKSVTSALAGIAISEGALGLDQSVGEFPGTWEPTDPRSKITIRDLLTMTSGLRWGWSEYFHIALTSFPALGFSYLMSYTLALPLEYEPGAHWSYSNSSLMLLNPIFKEAVGSDVATYARERIFEPLGMNSPEWPVNDDGESYPFGGLRATARDMARFGYLFLRNGKWEERSIVPEAWIEESQHPLTENLNAGYGYLWWINGYDDHWPRLEGCLNYDTPRRGYYFGEYAPLDTYAALGILGQMIIIVPSEDLILVRSARTEGHSKSEIMKRLMQSVVSD